MNTPEIVIVLLVVALAVLAGAFAALRGRRKRTEHLRGKFGVEYARAVEDSGGSAKAERDLQQREKRAEGYDLRPLTPEDRRRFGLEWARVQGRFVDNPTDAATLADDLLGQVMTARGYPEGPFDQRLGDLSVEHAVAVQGYRAAHEVALRRDRARPAPRTCVRR